MKIEYFGHFELRRRGVGNGSRSNNGRQIARSAVQFGKQDRCNWGETGKVHDEWNRLPLFRAEVDRLAQCADLIREWLRMIEVRRNLDHSTHRMPDQFGDAGKLRVGQRMRKIQQYHDFASPWDIYFRESKVISIGSSGPIGLRLSSYFAGVNCMGRSWRKQASTTPTEPWAVMPT